MLSIMDNLLGAIISIYGLMYVWSKLENKRIEYNNKRFYISLISCSLVSIFNYYFINTLIRLFIILIVIIIAFNYLFKTGIRRSIILAILIQIGLMVSDGVVAILLSVIFNLDNYSIISTLPKTLTFW